MRRRNANSGRGTKFNKFGHGRGVALLAFPLILGHLSVPVVAHPGGLNAAGCHNNRKTGDYHCHGGGGGAPKAPAIPQRLLGGSETYFPNCASARAAGAAPLRRGDPGYRPGLDRDGDGKACE